MDKHYVGTLLFMLIISTLVPEMQSARCCIEYKRRPVRCSQLKGYTIQTITRNCDLNAVIFQTVSGRLFCADPAMKWTQHRIDCLKQKALRIRGSTNLKS